MSGRPFRPAPGARSGAAAGLERLEQLMRGADEEGVDEEGVGGMEGGSAETVWSG